ncbi:hypothetical protein [Nocardia iowensis]|uniref:Uncharacterized protein n=1 Tax=Nocardia iowensis TaxID=204891 RepID=A0ABX8RXS4_NOCIO|nr:hypothetical protein [Nocardia iowensis]QXN94447.1 hypothetical protein KV110_16145 [Nocardia iowensis]
MAWERVGPTATGVAAVTGVFFTWLSGHQGRRQVEFTRTPSAVTTP